MKLLNDVVKAVLSLATVGAFLYLAVTTNEFKDALIGLTSAVMGYWVGSSLGSKEKTEMLK